MIDFCYLKNFINNSLLWIWQAVLGVNRTGTSIGPLVVSVVFGGPARWFIDKTDAGMNRLYSRDENLHQ